MKKYLLLCMILGAFSVPAGPAFADDHEWDNGIGNNSQVDDGSAGHSGDDAQ